MSRSGRWHVIGGALAVAMAASGFFALAQPASAGAPDVGGLWSAQYSLACSGSFDQTGSDVSGSLVCGEGIMLEVTGSFSGGAVSLAGDVSGVPLTVAGELSEDGDRIEGFWSAPPLVDGGEFFALREDEPSTEDIAGFWLINAQDIFSSECTAAIEQDGMQLAAELECEDGPSGQIEGEFDVETGNVSMTGPFGSVGVLEVRVNVAEDGESFTGVWRLLPDGPAGVMEGERLPQPAATPTEEDMAPTATPAMLLPETGTDGPRSSTSWVVPAIALLLAAGAAFGLAAYRVRS